MVFRYSVSTVSKNGKMEVEMSHTLRERARRKGGLSSKLGLKIRYFEGIVAP